MPNRFTQDQVRRDPFDTNQRRFLTGNPLFAARGGTVLGGQIEERRSQQVGLVGQKAEAQRRGRAGVERGVREDIGRAREQQVENIREAEADLKFRVASIKEALTRRIEDFRRRLADQEREVRESLLTSAQTAPLVGVAEAIPQIAGGITGAISGVQAQRASAAQLKQSEETLKLIQGQQASLNTQVRDPILDIISSRNPLSQSSFALNNNPMLNNPLFGFRT